MQIKVRGLFDEDQGKERGHDTVNIDSVVCVSFHFDECSTAVRKLIEFVDSNTLK